MPLRFASLRSERVRLAVLLVVLGALATYLAMSRTGVLAAGSGSTVEEACAIGGAPELASASRAELRGLREDVRGIVAFEVDIVPYEQGLVGPTAAWTDQEPGTSRSLPAGPSPAGYEMRWWMANGDDVVADAMVFADTKRAHDYLRRASSSRCRSAAVSGPASFPPGGRNLEWTNPFGYAQQDLFLQRGRRVYRVAVVKPAADEPASAAARADAFSLVNGLACALPGSECWMDGTPLSRA